MDAKVKIFMFDNSILALSQNTKLVLEKVNFQKKKKKSILNLMFGKFRGIVAKATRSSDDEYKVKAGTSVIGVRGTEFVMNYNPENKKLDLYTISGTIEHIDTTTKFNHPFFLIISFRSKISLAITAGIKPWAKCPTLS